MQPGQLSGQVARRILHCPPLRLRALGPGEYAETHEWIAFPRRYLSEESMATVYRNDPSTDTAALPGTTNS